MVDTQGKLPAAMVAQRTAPEDNGPLDRISLLHYTNGVKLGGDGRLWLHLGSTRRCLLQIVNGKLVYRFRDAKLDGTISGVAKVGGSANIDAIISRADAQIKGDKLILTIQLI